MDIIALAVKDWTQIARDRKSAIFLVLMPVLFTVIFGFAFATSESDARLPVGWIDDDPGGAFGDSLKRALEQSDTLRLIALDREQAEHAEKSVNEGKLAAVVIVPAGYSARLARGENAPLTMMAVPGTPGTQTASSGVQSAAKRILSAQEMARISADQLGLNPMDDTARAAVTAQVLAEAEVAWRDPDLAVRVERGVVASTTQPKTPSGFAQSSPGMIVQFAVFSLITSAMVLVLERNARTLQRMLTTPMSRVKIIAGNMLAMFGVVFLQTALLVLFGQFLFGVNYFREPVGMVLLTLALALWASSLGLLIGAGAKKEEQVVAASLIAMFVFAAMGGAWFPLEIAGSTFAAIGHLMPSAWAMDGLQNIVVRGLGLTSTLVPVGVLLAYAAAFLGLAAWRFRFE
jgi:ABC-2 type transport system permease protein